MEMFRIDLNEFGEVRHLLPAPSKRNVSCAADISNSAVSAGKSFNTDPLLKLSYESSTTFLNLGSTQRHS